MAMAEVRNKYGIMFTINLKQQGAFLNRGIVVDGDRAGGHEKFLGGAVILKQEPNNS